MALIYGSPAAESDLLSRAPESVEKIEDVEIIHDQLKEKLEKTKKEFFDKVPEQIAKEEKLLEKIHDHETATHQKYEDKIKVLQDKKSQGGFSIISTPVKVSFLKNISKRREIKKIKKIEQTQKRHLTEWKSHPIRIFNREKHVQINEYNEFSALKKSNVLKGAKGENQVLDKLSELSDDYHILCGIKSELPHYVRYNGKRNLRSAQIDFIVVSKKGVILIEVKNWSNKFYSETKKISPHEQADRAARVLWITINSHWGWLSGRSPGVTSVVLSIQGNIRYDPRYKYVMVSDLDQINYFIQNRKEQLSGKDVTKLVNMLKDHVTK